MGKELSTIYDLMYGLIKGYGLSTCLPLFSGSLEDFRNPVRIIDCLNARLTFRANGRINRVYVEG